MIAVSSPVLLVLAIALGLLFTLSNGLHDASSVVATFISSRAATPRQAILLASVFGLAGALWGGNAVARTVSTVIDLPPGQQLLLILLTSLLGAVLWNLLTWKLGLPSSSTHALIGGIIGAVLAASGPRHILWGWHELLSSRHQLTGITLVASALLFSPLLGFAFAFILGKLSKLAFRNASYQLNNWLNRLQWLIAALLSFSHGANDTQKVVGILVLALVSSSGTAMQTAPLWVFMSGGLLMFLGTLLGGWSIMKTIGRDIYTLQPIHSVNSQLASVGSMLFATMIGAPVSTTHVVVGTVLGVGSADRYKVVHWKIVNEIAMAWLVTIPSSAVISAIIYTALRLLFTVTPGG